MSTPRAIAGAVAVLATLLIAPSVGHAADWPSQQPITLILPSAAGGSSDPLARLMAEEMGRRLGQSFVVMNRPGAGGNLGMAQAARAKPDGYSIAMAWTGPLATNLALYKSVGYDPQKDFAPIGLLGCTPNVLAVKPSFPANTLAEFIEYARNHRGKVSYGTTGVGSSWHLAGEMLSQATATGLVHIPYQSPGGAMTDLLGGRLEAIFPVVPMTVPHVQAGELKILAVYAKERVAVLPKAPTTAEQGRPDLVSDTCFALLAPRETPKSVIERLNIAMNQVLDDATARPKIEAMGLQVRGGTSASMAAWLAEQVPAQARLVKAAGASAQ